LKAIEADFMKITTQTLTSILPAILLVGWVNAQDKPTAAVLDFEARGISALEAQTLTDRFSGELVNTSAIIMVERNQMDEILDEQGFQQSGCTSAECAAEIGALLGVQKMISGSFGKLGNTYTIEAKIFSVETGQTERAVSKTYKGEIDGLLDQIALVAWELMGLQPPPDLMARAGVKPPEPEKAAKEGGGSNWLLWTLVGLGVAGGGAAAAMGGGGDAGSDGGGSNGGGNGGGGGGGGSELPEPPGTP